MRFVKQTSWALALCVLGGALSSVANAQNEQVTRMKAALAAPDRLRQTRSVTRPASRSRRSSSPLSRTGQTVLEVVAFALVHRGVVGGRRPTASVCAEPDLLHRPARLREAEKARN